MQKFQGMIEATRDANKERYAAFAEQVEEAS